MTSTAENLTDGLTEEPGSAPSRSSRLPSLASTWNTLRSGLDIDRGVLAELAADEFTRVRMGTRRFVAISNADQVDHVLHANRLNYVKSNEYEPIRTAAGINLLTDEGDSWAAHRGAVNPMFAKRRLNELFELMLDPVEDAADELGARDGRVVVDLHEEMVQLTLRVVANSLFSQDFGELIDKMHDLATRGLEATEMLLRMGMVGLMPRPVYAILSRVIRLPIPVPPPFRLLQEVVSGLDRGVNEIVDQRYANPTDAPDLLNMLVGADDGAWPRQRVRDEALTFILAGHETTANALSWFWYLMALNPQHRDRMLEEIDRVLKGRRPTTDDLAELPWTTACVMESQRFYSAVPVVMRTALQDDVIGGHRVRKGTTVMIPIHAIHHDERYWDKPEEFDPTRFLPNAPRPIRSTYLPFGGGRRVCIGQSFALMEMVAIAAMLSQRFEFDLVPGHPVVPAQSLTLRPRHGIRTVVRRRADAPGSRLLVAQAPAASGCPIHNEDTTEVQP